TNPILWQSFFGQEISCSSKIFDRRVPDLMSFLPSFDDGVAFSYILPFSETEGLLETTVFGPQILTIKDFKERQNGLVEKITKGNPFEVGRCEYGALPMGHFKANGPSLETYFKVGNTSGSLRPSTGFAFQRIQKWAEACSKSIRNGSGPLHYMPDPWHIRMMDYLFLRVIREDPRLGSTLFYNIFKKARPDQVIRFLSDQGTWGDCASIIAALPSEPFFRMLLKNLNMPSKGSHS
ncbi:MAG: lycopene cyclase family protein, partial [Gloeotrichia echinulata HAB0833]